MPEEVKIKITSEADLKALEATGLEFEKIEKSATEADKALKKSGSEVKKAGDASKGASKKMEGVADALDAVGGKAPLIGNLSQLLRGLNPAAAAGFAVTAIGIFITQLQKAREAALRLVEVDMDAFEEHFVKLKEKASDFRRELGQVRAAQAAWESVEAQQIEADRSRQLLELDEGQVTGSERRRQEQEIEEEAVRKRAALKVKERKRDLDAARKAEIEKSKTLNAIEEERDALYQSVRLAQLRKEAKERVATGRGAVPVGGSKGYDQALAERVRQSPEGIQRASDLKFLRETKGSDLKNLKEAEGLLLKYNKSVSDGQDELDTLASKAQILSDTLGSLNAIAQKNLETDIRESEAKRRAGDVSGEAAELALKVKKEREAEREAERARGQVKRDREKQERERLKRDREQERAEEAVRKNAREQLEVVAGVEEASGVKIPRGRGSEAISSDALRDLLDNTQRTEAELAETESRVVATFKLLARSQSAQAAQYRATLTQLQEEMKILSAEVTGGNHR